MRRLYVSSCWVSPISSIILIFYYRDGGENMLEKIKCQWSNVVGISLKSVCLQTYHRWGTCPRTFLQMSLLSSSYLLLCSSTLSSTASARGFLESAYFSLSVCSHWSLLSACLVHRLSVLDSASPSDHGSGASNLVFTLVSKTFLSTGWRSVPFLTLFFHCIAFTVHKLMIVTSLFFYSPSTELPIGTAYDPALQWSATCSQ